MRQLGLSNAESLPNNVVVCTEEEAHGGDQTLGLEHAKNVF